MPSGLSQPPGCSLGVNPACSNRSRSSGLAARSTGMIAKSASVVYSATDRSEFPVCM